MAKLQNFNGRYCEADFENAFLSFLEAEGWQYLFGNSIPAPPGGTFCMWMTWSSF